MKRLLLSLFQDLYKLLEKHLSLGDSPDEDGKVMSTNERYIQDKLEKGREFVDGRYILPCTWRPGHPNLPNNYDYALSRLYSLEKSKVLQKPGIREAYTKKFQEYITKKYLRIVPEAEERIANAAYWSHFPVVKENRETTKVRPVFDGKSEFKGMSINKATLPGPKLINELRTVITRFRKHPVTACGDISEHFLQVGLKDEDKPYHRFLWREGPNERVREYEWQRHVFGNCGSPCVAIFAIKRHALDYEQSYPRAVETILHSTIVDDNIDSVNTVEEAIQLLKDLKQIYKEAGMTIAKFSSNKREVMEAFEESDKAAHIKLLEDKDYSSEISTKALGVGCDLQTDTLNYELEVEIKEKETWTKRDLASMYGRLYDPLGLLLPYLTLGKKIFQETWADGVTGWRDKIPEVLQSRWESWISQINIIKEIRIFRCLRKVDDLNVVRQEVHFFSDASQLAYGCCAYLRTIYASGSPSMHLIQAIGHLVPRNNTKTIQRLELEACFLILKLISDIRRAYSKEEVPDASLHFWTDNQNCLCWMRNDERNVSGFIQRRVDSIKTKTLLENWRYVDTKKNPADLPSRGLSASELRDSQLWWFGPDYLQSNDESWKQDSFKPEFSQDALKEFIKTRQMVMCNVEGIAEEDEFSEVQSEEDVADEVLALTRQQVKARRRNKPGLDKDIVRVDNFFDFERYSSWDKMIRRYEATTPSQGSPLVKNQSETNQIIPHLS